MPREMALPKMWKKVFESKGEMAQAKAKVEIMRSVAGDIWKCTTRFTDLVQNLTATKISGNEEWPLDIFSLHSCRPGP